MKILDIRAAVEHIKPARTADAYAGQESLTFLRCKVSTTEGITGEGVTGRFLADQVAHLLNGGIAATARGMDALDIEAVTAQLAKNSIRASPPACSCRRCRHLTLHCGTSRANL